jgi:hypothetical protein
LELRQIVGENGPPWRFLAENMSDGTLRALGVTGIIRKDRFLTCCALPVSSKDMANVKRFRFFSAGLLKPLIHHWTWTLRAVSTRLTNVIGRL